MSDRDKLKGIVPASERLPQTLPILPLAEAALFPQMVLPLVMVLPNQMKMVDDSMRSNRLIGCVAAKDPSMAMTAHPDNIYNMGTAGLILKFERTEDDKAQLLIQGITRFKVDEIISDEPYVRAAVSVVDEIKRAGKRVDALMSSIITSFINVLDISPGMPSETRNLIKTIKDPGMLADVVTSLINVPLDDKQKILEILDVKERLKEVNRLVNYQLEILELGNKIQSQVKDDMDKKQREYILRQQMKTIQEELGEEGDQSNIEIEEYRTKLLELELPEDAHKEAERELKRLSRMHPSSSEYTVSSTYLDWIISLPWGESSVDNENIKKARKVLDDDHFGLEKPKKRIIEYLAVKKLKPDSKGPILCFVGPPGTGKTSLGRSIARALGRKFIRISLGGVRDEAEIRGHRRTYVGALPGRIIQGIRRAGTNNPVFMLDEIDKVGSDFRGDPSSALLEVLDPEQNFSFSDHYLDVPFDLTNVMFITTANILDTIPPPLRDRMEVIELVGYTIEEKLKIASKYLIPRQLDANGLNSKMLKFSKTSTNRIITDYTREAGLRNLEREIGSVCRGVASKIAMEEETAVTIKIQDIAKYLGPIKFISDINIRLNVPGIAVGLAWTQTGGDVLFIEATSMRGKKGLILTGQLGDVMKESAQAALSYIRSNAVELGIDEDYFENHDIHIHVPEGAIPKDGPSAGVTMLTALTSLLTNKMVKKNLAMTGEITLRGQVLPVGGIKEKVLAAHRAGIKKLVLPKFNKKDIEDVPKKVQRQIEFFFIEKMNDVLKTALDK